MNKNELEKELGNILSIIYENGKEHSETNQAIQIFGIIYASKIKNYGLSIRKIISYSTLSDSYQSELSKGINLSQYIQLSSSITKFISSLDKEVVNEINKLVDNSIYLEVSKISNFNLEPTQKIYIGPPGSGKSYRAGQFCNVICSDKNDITRVVFHPEYENSDFIGSLLPTSNRDDKVRYEFVPGPFTLILEKALKNPHKPYVLLIEEMTRGNCAAIFGDIFQLLDRDKSTRLSEYPINHLNMQKYLKIDSIILPGNLSIIGTINSSDQNVFPMDTAFKRRFDLVYVNPIEEGYEVNDFEILGYKWSDLCKCINNVICYSEHLAEDKQIGFYFIEKPKDEKGELENLQKLCIYLWHDVDKFIHDSKNKVLVHSNEMNNLGMLINKLNDNNLKLSEIFSKKIIDILNGTNE